MKMFQDQRFSVPCARIAAAVVMIGMLAAGCGETGGSFAGDGMPARKLMASQSASGLAFDRFGRLIIADPVNGTVSFMHDNGLRMILAEGMGDVRGVAVDRKNNVFVCSRSRGEVYRIRPDGQVMVVAEGLDQPYQLAVDRDGNVFAATAGDNGIWRISGGGFELRKQR